MIPCTMRSAILLGVGVLIVGQILYLVDVATPGPQALLDHTLWLTPGVASLCSTIVARRQKIVAGLSIVFFGTTITMISMYLYRVLGVPIDNIGRFGTTLVIVLVYHAVVCSIATGFGIVVSAWVKRSYE